MNKQELLSLLDSLGIAPADRRYEHPAVFTCEEADSLASHVPGGHAKNLFLRNKNKSQYYLVSVLAEKRVDLMAVARLFGESKISFGSPDDLQEILGLTPGSVSPFGLANDPARRVRLVLDSDLATTGMMGFHPNENTMTVLVDERELKIFLAHTGHEMIMAKIPEKTI